MDRTEGGPNSELRSPIPRLRQLQQVESLQWVLRRVSSALRAPRCLFVLVFMIALPARASAMSLGSQTPFGSRLGDYLSRENARAPRDEHPHMKFF